MTVAAGTTLSRVVVFQGLLLVFVYLKGGYVNAFRIQTIWQVSKKNDKNMIICARLSKIMLQFPRVRLLRTSQAARVMTRGCVGLHIQSSVNRSPQHTQK